MARQLPVTQLVDQYYEQVEIGWQSLRHLQLVIPLKEFERQNRKDIRL